MTLVVKKTTTTVGKRKKTVTRRIAGVAVPVYPDHTDRSVFINQQAIPFLRAGGARRADQSRTSS